MPNFLIENEQDGRVCGLDEVGRGPLAGPVVAACVFIPEDKRTLDFVADIKDSKKITFPKLEMLYELITEHFEYGVAEISPAEIDEINILQASLKAMSKAFDNMASLRATAKQSMDCRVGSNDPPRNDVEEWFALVDGNKLPKLPCRATCVVKGESKSKSIAAASIIAKVTRDRIMHQLAKEFPHYGWDTNVGYPSQAHRDAILEHGITEHHRKSFGPVRNYLDNAA